MITHKRMSKNSIIAIVGLVFVSIFSLVITGLDMFHDNQIGMIPIWVINYSFVLHIAFSHEVNNRGEMHIIVASWIVRLVCAVIGTFGINLNGYDEYGFMRMASEALRNTGNDFRAEIWKVFLVEYHIFGESEYLIRITNGFIGMLGLCTFAYCLRIIKVTGIVRKNLIMIAAFAPETIFLSIGMLRESFYYLGTMLSFAFFIRWLDSRKLIYMIICLLMTLPSIWLHSGHVVIPAAYCLMFIISKPKRKNSLEVMYKVALILMGALSVYILFCLGLMHTLYTKIPVGTDFSTFIAGVMNSNLANYQEAASGYLGNTLDVTTIGQFILYTPLRMVYFLYSPMIWDCYRIKDFFGLIFDSSIFITGTWILLRKIKQVRMYDQQGFFIAMCGILIILLVSFAFGWGTMAAGTAMRHRNVLIPIICIIVGICYKDKGDLDKRILQALRVD